MQIATSTRAAGVSGFAFTIGDAIRRSRSGGILLPSAKRRSLQAFAQRSRATSCRSNTGAVAVTRRWPKPIPFQPFKKLASFCQSLPPVHRRGLSVGFAFLWLPQTYAGLRTKFTRPPSVTRGSRWAMSRFGGRAHTRAIVARRPKLIGSSDPWWRSGLAEKAAH